MPKLLITGADGQVGRELRRAAADYPGLSCHFAGRLDLDITDEYQVAAFLERHRIEVVINCAAYTAVDQAESEPDKAALVNTIAPGFLAKACAARDGFLLQLSTDYVYHSSVNRPLLETDTLHPQSVYARTKKEGEDAVLAFPGHSMVIRTSWVYSAYGRNFLKTMLRLGAERDALRIVYDQVGTPTYARDLAYALLDIVQQGTYRQNPGIYNFSNEGVCSWYDFALAIFDEAPDPKIDCAVTPILSEDYPTPAARPAFSLMHKGKIKNTFGLIIPHWRESMRACLKDLQALSTQGT